MLIRTVRRTAFFPLLLAAAASAALLLAPTQALAQGSKPKPIAVITLNSLDNLLEDINFVGSLAGQPRMADQVRPFIGMLQGLDTAQPVGLVLQADEVSPSGALCIPTKDLKMLLGGMQMFGVTNKEGPGGTVEIGAQGQTLFAKEAGGWAFLSMMPQMLENLPANPGQLFGDLTKDYDLSVRLHVQNIPEAYKETALSALEAGMESNMKRMEEESDEQFEARKQMAKLQVEQLKQAAQELDQLTVGMALDGQQQRTYLDIVYTAIPGSQLAEQIKSSSDAKTDYAGFFQPDAAMMLSFASKVKESDIGQIDQAFTAAYKQMVAKIDQEVEDASEEEKQVMKDLVSDIMGAFQATLKAGKLDGGMVVNVSPASFSLVIGGFIAEPGKIENSLKKFDELAKEKGKAEYPGIDWSSATHRNVKFHTLSMPIPEGNDEENARQIFGNTVDAAIGIGPESVYFSLGRDCVDAVKNIIDASAAAPQKSIAPMEMSFSLRQIMETVAAFADEDDKAQVEMIANMLSNEANGSDHVRIVVQPIANGARTRIEAEEGVLKSIGMAAMAAQMKEMEAAGAGAPGGF